MKVTLNWLKQYVDFDFSSEQLAERLTMLGIEVEGVQKISAEFEGIVVAQVITRDKHPNADKLSLCRVNDGQGERQIVCGAHNFKAGDKVPLILPGQSLPARPGAEKVTIKAGKIRGYESQGMLCSPQELGLPDQVDGLLILREDAKVGQSFAEYLGRSAGDVVYDLEITPNRPDLNSVIGIARELSAVTGNSLRIPEVGELPKGGASASELVRVELVAPDLCPRYTARVVRNLKIGPSPDWLRATLEKVGVRPINNVVDVTNYVMLETGQPLHAFDYRLLSKSESGTPTIVVRRAAADEKFKTLDGEERVLSDQMLLIADSSRGIALAGIMGGENTEINPNTTDVLLESAYFNPQNVRATSKRLDLRTESSYRFERGADIEICEWGSRRAAQIIVQIAGGECAEGIVDAYPKRHEAQQIGLQHARTTAVLGIEISPARQSELLERLGLDARPDATGSVTNYRAPSFRVDLKREIDLIEEIARLHGVDKIPSTPPRGAVGTNEFDSTYDQIGFARTLLKGLGFTEAQGQTLISDSARTLFPELPAVALANPLSSDMNTLRMSLVPGMLDALAWNARHGTPDVAIFEVGRVFLTNPNANTPAAPKAKGNPKAAQQFIEERRVAMALTGKRHPLFWEGEDRHALFDAFDLKGRLEEFFEQFGARAIAFTRRTEPTVLFVESATVQLGKFQLGQIGLLSPQLARRYDLRSPVYIAELSLDILLARRNPSRSFRPLPTLPAIRRDIAILLPESTTHQAVLDAVRQQKTEHLEAVELFDVFRGQGIPDGQKSVAYAFTYRGVDRNLTDAEVNTAHEQLTEKLKAALGGIVRQ